MSAESLTFGSTITHEISRTLAGIDPRELKSEHHSDRIPELADFRLLTDYAYTVFLLTGNSGGYHKLHTLISLRKTDLETSSKSIKHFEMLVGVRALYAEYLEDCGMDKQAIHELEHISDQIPEDFQYIHNEPVHTPQQINIHARIQLLTLDLARRFLKKGKTDVSKRLMQRKFSGFAPDDLIEEFRNEPDDMHRDIRESINQEQIPKWKDIIPGNYSPAPMQASGGNIFIADRSDELQWAAGNLAIGAVAYNQPRILIEILQSDLLTDETRVKVSRNIVEHIYRGKRLHPLE